MNAVEQLRQTTRPRIAPSGLPSPPAPIRPPLRVVPPKRVGPLVRRRRARLLMVTVGLMIASGMFAIVGAQVVLTQRQLRLDQVDQAISRLSISNGQLALDVASLQSPARIVSEAQSRLGMVSPASIVYLFPGAKPSVAKVPGVQATVPPSGTTSSIGAPTNAPAG